ncbi:MAG: polysaccharide deacetylase [Planctomycetes bacterium]|nr:polysaccharide deacetylase [Planctomycetota bacterium]
MKTQVLLTVDIEFSIAGTFREPARCHPVGTPAVDCEIAGQSHGLGFLLETLAAHRLTATFFVETLNVHYFGDAPMAAVARRIQDAGHDVQLHLHPCWTTFRQPDWPERVGAAPPGDSMAGRAPEEVAAIVAEGAASLCRWGLPPPVALRTGSFRVDRAVYAGLRRAGLPLASSVGLALFRPAEPELRLTGGRHWIDGVLEVPLLAFTDLRLLYRRHLKNLTITGCSGAELRWVLGAAHRYGVRTVVLLTHPFEFVKYNEAFTALRPDRVNQRRFRGLCAFLDRHRDAFETTTFAECHSRWITQGEEAAPDLATPPWLTVGRWVMNRWNEAW